MYGSSIHAPCGPVSYSKHQQFSASFAGLVQFLFQSFEGPAVIRTRFSDCGLFRFLFAESWDVSKPCLPWLLFNPSVAGREVDGEIKGDPTARKVRGFSERLGYGGYAIANPYAYVSTDPAGLKRAGYPVGAGNDEQILEVCAMGTGDVVCGWGALGRGLSRPVEVLKMIRAAGYQPMALGFTADGLPRHPLMLGYSTPLVPMFPRPLAAILPRSL